jgi:threonine dehydrogenase-like Zn-dependent dehydrogenase
VGLTGSRQNSLRPRLLKQIGGTYFDGRLVEVTDIDAVCGEMDFVFEATGIAKLQIQLLDTLGINGIYVATGIPAGKRPMTIMAGNILQQMVLKNQIFLGSVNASLAHYQMAVDDLLACYGQWPEQLQQVITERIPYTDFETALHNHSMDEIKVVVEWV